MLENARPLRYNKYIKRKHPLQSGCSQDGLSVFTDTAYPVGRQDRHFYFRLLFLEELFSLSRKASNATIKLPNDISNANIEMLS